MKALLPALALFLNASVAFAQNSSALAAEAKFSDGVRLMKAGQCEQALPSFRESQALEPASGTLLNIAYCEAQLGKTASAWFAYRKALALAESSSRAQHERIARQEIEKLEPELPYLSVQLERNSASIVRVELDGHELESAVWAVETPVDPGSHTLRVFSHGNLKWENTFTITPRERRTLSVPSSALVDAAPEPGSRAPAHVAAPPSNAAEHAPTARASRSTAATVVTLTTAGVGAIGFVAASVLFVGARHDYDDVSGDCPLNVCQNRTSYEQRTAAIRRFHWSLGVGGGSVALLGVATAVWFASKPHSERGVGSVSIDVASNRVGVSWQRGF